MPYEGVLLVPTSGAGEGVTNSELQDTGTINADNGSNRWGQGGTAVWKLHKPNQTLVTTDPGTGPNDFGYNVLKTNMNASANLPARRRIEAGNWVFSVILVGSVASLNNSWQVRVRIYKRSSAGVLIQLSTDANSLSSLFTLAIGAQVVLLSANSMPEVILETDETIQVEYNIRGQGAALGNIDVTFRRGNQNIGTTPRSTSISLPGQGLRYDYPRSAITTTSLVGSSTNKINGAAKVAALSLTSTAIRKITATRSFTTALTLVTSVTRRTTLGTKVATLDISTGIRKAIAPTNKIATLNLTTSVTKRITLIAKATALTLTATSTRTITAARAFITNLTLGTVFARSVTSARSFTTNISMSTAVSRQIAAKRLFTSTLSLGTSLQRGIVLNAKTATLTLTGLMTRTVLASRAFTTGITLGTVFGRSVISARSFSTNIILSAKGRVDMAFEALNRIVGGGGSTIIKRVIHIFDD